MNGDLDLASNRKEESEQPTDLNFEHDLRNIYSAMQSAMDVIRLDKNLSKDSFAMLAILDRQLMRLARTVSERPNQTADLGSSLSTIEPKTSFRAADNLPIRKQDILVVDDTRLVSYSLQMMLEKLGQSVRSVSNGVSALEAMREKMPDIVFSDIGMVGMNGLELAKYIRSIPEAVNVRLIALTGCSKPDAKRISIEAGFDDHLEKPMAYATLFNILNGLS